MSYLFYICFKLSIMSSKLLLPHKYKSVGWGVLIVATIAGIVLLVSDLEKFPIKAHVFAFFNEQLVKDGESFQVIYTNVTPTIVGILFLTGALLVSFSREKREDEFIAKLRQSSLLWAVLLNYVLLIVCFLFVYGFSFLNVMLYNMFTVLVLFIIRFNYILYRSSKDMPNEKYN
jgi:hypothetical protein